MTTTNFRSAYGPRHRVRRFIDPETDMCEQQHKDEVDINNIVNRYHRDRVLPNIVHKEALFGDFLTIPFEEAQDRVNHSRELFNSLPSQLRSEFNHSISEFLGFAELEENQDTLRQWGLLPPLTPPEEVKPPPETPPEAPPSEIIE